MPSPRRALPPEEEYLDESSAELSAEDASDTSDAGPEQSETEVSAAKPSWRSLFAFGRGQVVVAFVLFCTAVLVVTTFRAQSVTDVYDNMRRDELIQLLDNATTQTRRLEVEVADLREVRDELASGAAGAAAAEEEAQRRLEQLQMLAGTIPVKGPGVRIVINDPARAVTPGIILNGLEELRDAGAEVVEFNDAIRITATSWVGLDEAGRLVIDGQRVERPITIEAIGDPATLEAGARFRGGLVSEIEGPQVGGMVDIVQEEALEIHSLATPRELEHGRPR